MAAPSPARAQEELSRCIIELLLQEPFLGHLLSSVARAITDATPTAAVALTDRGVQLQINPDYFLRTLRRRPDRVGVVKHECLHLLLKHLIRLGPGLDPGLFNVAADLVVNQLIGRWPLPDDAVTLASFPELALPPDQTVEAYYERLLALRGEMIGAGWRPGEPELPEGAHTATPESASALAGRLAGPWHSDHRGWASGQPEAIPQPLADALDGQLERMIEAAWARTSPEGRGLVPGHLRQQLQARLQARRPTIDWRRCVRIFGHSSRRTRIVGTYRRESRRYSKQSVLGDGTVPTPGIKVRQLSRLAVAIDTSGSISGQDLDRFFSEIHGLWRAGAQIDVLECDAALQRIYTYQGVAPRGVQGRGGTRFDPVFAHLRRIHRQTRYDGCIYLTDGDAPAPSLAPPCKLLWIVTATGTVGPHLTPGRILRLPAR